MGLRRRRTDTQVVHGPEINVTPLIDVMLVLLVIFMMTAPLSTVNVPVDLPSSTTQPTPRAENPIFVTIRADHALALGEEVVAPGMLLDRLKNLTIKNPEERIFLRADKTVDYGCLMKTMNLLREAGFLKVALVNLHEPEAGSGP